MNILSVSNIAWNIEDDKKVLEILKNNKIKFIDIAPTKYFEYFPKYQETNLEIIRTFWKDNGINFFGMQSLLYNFPDLNIFSSDSKKLLDQLEKVIQLADKLDIKKAVFGSPKNRDKKLLSQLDAEKQASSFFRELSSILDIYDVDVCIEPNPKEYGCNFGVNSEEVYYLVKKINHEKIKMQLDLGAVQMNNENIDLIVSNYADKIGYIHISEPSLLPINNVDFHKYTSTIIKKRLGSRHMALEMRNPNSLDELQNSIERFVDIYAN